MADEHINDSAYSDTSDNQDDLPVDDVLHDTDDSGYTLDFIFDDDIIDIFQDEPLPSLEEFIDEVQQKVLTSTDPTETLECRLNKINSPSKSLSITL